MAWPVKPSGMSWYTANDGQQFVDVNGVGVFPVLSNEATASKLNDNAGKPILWPSVRELRLAADLVVYGCADCSYANKSANSVRPHRNKHRGQKQAAVNGEVTALLRNALREVAPDQSAKIEKLTAEREEWKRRALAAERRWSALRQAFSGVTDQ